MTEEYDVTIRGAIPTGEVDILRGAIRAAIPQDARPHSLISIPAESTHPRQAEKLVVEIQTRDADDPEALAVAQQIQAAVEDWVREAQQRTVMRYRSLRLNLSSFPGRYSFVIF